MPSPFFLSIARLSVTLAGFSGLVAAFRLRQIALLEWMLVLIQARPMLTFILVVAAVSAE